MKQASPAQMRALRESIATLEAQLAEHRRTTKPKNKPKRRQLPEPQHQAMMLRMGVGTSVPSTGTAYVDGRHYIGVPKGYDPRARVDREMGLDSRAIPPLMTS
jgi:hypothetical protein